MLQHNVSHKSTEDMGFDEFAKREPCIFNTSVAGSVIIYVAFMGLMFLALVVCRNNNIELKNGMINCEINILDEFQCSTGFVPDGHIYSLILYAENNNITYYNKYLTGCVKKPYPNNKCSLYHGILRPQQIGEMELGSDALPIVLLTLISVFYTLFEVTITTLALAICCTKNKVSINPSPERKLV